MNGWNNKNRGNPGKRDTGHHKLKRQADRGQGTRKLNGYRIFMWDGEKVLEMHIADGCTATCIYLMPLNYIFKKRLKWEILCYINVTIMKKVGQRRKTLQRRLQRKQQGG